MSALKKPVAALIGVIAVLLAGVFFDVGSAGAYPGTTSATISVTTSTPDAGQTIGVAGAAFQPNEAISVEFHSVAVTLAGVTANGSGGFSTSVTIPAGASGSHEIVGTGLTSGEVAVAAIQVKAEGTGTGTGTGTGSGSGTGSSGLSNTGVAVIGIGALGVVLLVGGGLLLMAGKRRKVSV